MLHFIVLQCTFITGGGSGPTDEKTRDDKRMLADGYRCAINTAAVRCYIILDSHTRTLIPRSPGRGTGLGTCDALSSHHAPPYRPVGGGPKRGQGRITDRPASPTQVYQDTSFASTISSSNSYMIDTGNTPLPCQTHVISDR